MADAENGSCKFVPDRWVSGRLVVVLTKSSGRNQIVVPHGLFACYTSSLRRNIGVEMMLYNLSITQHNWQIFVVSYLLDLCDDDASRLLEQQFVTPQRIDLFQSSGDAVVFAHHQRVQNR